MCFPSGVERVIEGRLPRPPLTPGEELIEQGSPKAGGWLCPAGLPRVLSFSVPLDSAAAEGLGQTTVVCSRMG